MKKSIFILISTLILLSQFLNITSLANNEIEVLTLIPLRSSLENVGYEVNWNSENNSVVVSKDGKNTNFSQENIQDYEKIYIFNGISYFDISILKKLGIDYSVKGNKIVVNIDLNNYEIPKSINFDDGTKLDLSEKNDKNKLIIFGADWCPYCQEYLRNLNNFVTKWDEEKFDILYLDLSEMELSESKGKIKIVNDVERKYFKYFNPQVLPTTYIINNKGKIVEKIEGSISISDIEKVSLKYELLHK